MDNNDLQEVVDAILQAILSMEERINKKFDAIDNRFDKLEAKVEQIDDDVKDIQADLKIVTGRLEKQDLELKKIKRAM